MAKRFTDSEKYKKPFVRSLQGPYKLLWDYIYHDCDNAGIWIVDFEVAQIYLGKDMQVNRSDALRFFNADQYRVHQFDDGKKWFIPSYISFQYNELSENNPAHKKVISTLRCLGFLKDLIVPVEDLQRTSVVPSQGTMYMDKVMDKVEVKVKKAETEKFNPVDHIPESWNTESFLSEWSDFMIMRHRKKWACTDSILISRIKQLRTLSEDKWDKALTIMQKSTEKGYAEFFAPDRNGSTNTSQIRKIKDERQPAVRDRA